MNVQRLSLVVSLIACMLVVIIADEILVERHVTLLAGTGQKFEGEQRSYTLENLASDQS